MRRTWLLGLALGALAAVACDRADADADAGPDCVAECGACDTDGTPCCGGEICAGWGYDGPDERHCQPESFTDSDLCADPETGTDGSCAPLGLDCTYWHETDSGGEEQLCTCDGWDYSVID